MSEINKDGAKKKSTTGAQVFLAIKAAKKVAIFSHKNPDHDACGSAFAVREICRNLGKTAEFFGISGNAQYLGTIFPIDEMKTNFVAREFDLVIVCDLHAVERLDGCFLEEIQKCKNVFVIDHHEDSDEQALPQAKALILPEKAATCEILVDIAKENKLKLPGATATYLWAGLVGDTGRFLHSNLSENVMSAASFLLSQGARAQEVYNQMYRSVTQKDVRVHADFLRSVRFVCDGQAAIGVFGRGQFKKVGASFEDYKKYTSLMANVKGVRVSILCFEAAKGEWKVSVRSNGITKALEVCASLGGGGHENACGFPLKSTKRKICKNITLWAEKMLEI